jgi:transglutaminase-like putative cysteine protease
MRIRVAHQTVYRYDPPAKAIIQSLRLTPRSHDGQRVSRWRIDLADADGRLRPFEDSFGNLCHTLSVTGPVDTITVLVEGEVETLDTSGVVRGTVERFPEEVYLRVTDLTQPDDAIQTFAEEATAGTGDRLAALHRLMHAVHQTVTYDPEPTQSSTTAIESFTLKKGVCQDLAHIFIAGARHLGIPARYVGGYLWREDGVEDQHAGHAWAEAFVPDLGWVGFDPANAICPAGAHLRVAMALDYLGAAPVRGSRYGGGAEAMVVSVRVDNRPRNQRQSQGLAQSQSQSQS